MELATVVGLFGAIAYLAGYALIQMRVLTIEDGRYAALNIIGGLCLIYSLLWNFNLGSFLTQAAWLVFTVVGFFYSRRRRKQMAATAAAAAAALTVTMPPPANDSEQAAAAVA